MSDGVSTMAIVTLADTLREQAGLRSDKLAFICDDQSCTYAELDHRANQCANGLLSLELAPDDRVAYLGKNTHLYFELLMAVSRAGGVTCPINWRLAPAEISYILNDTKASILVVGAEFAGIYREIAADVPGIAHVLCMEGNDPELQDYETWRDGFDNCDLGVTRAPADAALQLYTSGTTGHPKGAVLSNQAMLVRHASRNPPQTEAWQGWTADDVSLVAMPCFHIGGTGWGLSGLYAGATGIVMREFDPNRVLALMQAHGISKIFMVPAAMKIVVEHPDARSTDFSAMKYMLYGASPIPLDLLRTCIDVFQCGFVQMYGMTETAGTIVALSPEDHDPNGNDRMRSVGKPLDGVEVKIIDAKGNRVPVGDVGEIATRSEANMSHYWNMDAATDSTIDGQGWLRTGDAGYMDTDGYIYIHDRVKDMIISGGENVYPAEVENAVFGHSAVADVGVVGVPDDKWGEAVKAFVVLKADETATAEDIIAFARTRIAAFKCPKSVDFIDTLPRNPSGKILRRDLRAPYWAGKDRAVN